VRSVDTNVLVRLIARDDVKQLGTFDRDLARLDGVEKLSG